jgi:hypothetical protein
MYDRNSILEGRLAQNHVFTRRIDVSCDVEFLEELMAYWTPSYYETPPASRKQHVDAYTYLDRSPISLYSAHSYRDNGLTSSRGLSPSLRPDFSTPVRSTTPVRLSFGDSPRADYLRNKNDLDEANATRCVSSPHPSRAQLRLSPPSPMVTDACSTFIPAQRPEDRGKPVVVLDLDETLIFARNGPVIARPGLAHLFRVMKGRCEVVVWTAGERDYALDAIKRIDPDRCVQHCVYRHRKWWTGLPGYTKDLCALGRPLERTVLIENTPDCTRANPLNSILVKDFHGDCRAQDSTIYQLADIIESIISGCYRRCHISDTIQSHPHVALREVPCDSDGTVTVFTLSDDYHPPVYSSTNFDLQRGFRNSQIRR